MPAVIFERHQIAVRIGPHRDEGIRWADHVEQLAVFGVVIDVRAIFLAHPHRAVSDMHDALVVNRDMAVSCDREVGCVENPLADSGRI